MKAFRLFLILVTIGIFSITLTVGITHGWNLIPVFLNNILELNWSGQFNFDFLCYLILSGLWIAWRNNFSGFGILLGVIASIAGILFFAPYLLIESFRANGDIKILLLGKSEEK